MKKSRKRILLQNVQNFEMPEKIGRSMYGETENEGEYKWFISGRQPPFYGLQ